MRTLPDFDNEHHRILDHPAGIELAKRIYESLANDHVFQRLFFSTTPGVDSFCDARGVPVAAQTVYRNREQERPSPNLNELQPAPEN